MPTSVPLTGPSLSFGLSTTGLLPPGSSGGMGVMSGASMQSLPAITLAGLISATQMGLMSQALLPTALHNLPALPSVATQPGQMPFLAVMGVGSAPPGWNGMGILGPSNG